MIPDIEPSRCEPALCLYGARVLARKLWDMLDEIPGVRENRDPECVHKMRVASRRFRNALSLFSACFPQGEEKSWEREARKVARALGRARDLDVQKESVAEALESVGDPHLKPGIERLLLRLTQSRERVQESVLKAVTALDEGRLKGEMPEALRALSVEMRLKGASESDAVVRDHAVLLVARRFEELMAFDTVADRPERVEELHAMRIAAKHLRYSLENFRPLFPGSAESFLERLKEMQDLLGVIHDCDVWIARLPAFMEEERRKTLDYFGHARPFSRLRPGIVHLQEMFRDRRAERFSSFRKFWRDSRALPSWVELPSVLRGDIP
jgi:CHAD domain-containing protein